jgi:hypothetical protein
MGRIRRTFELAKSSWRVLQQDRELLVLPVLSFVVSAMVLVPLLVVAFVYTDGTTTNAAGEESADPAMIVIFVVAALAISVVGVFFNGALVAGAHQRFTGGDPTIGSALDKAARHLPGLIGWALLTATVGLILQALRERAGFLARFVINLVGAAWDVATFLVVPAVIIDDNGAIDGLKRSASLLRQTWGENIAARVGFGLLGLVLVIPGFAIGGLAVAVGGPVLIAGILVAVVWIALVVVVMTALNAIFQTALYMYATTGSMPTGFETTDLRQTFGPREAINS